MGFFDSLAAGYNKGVQRGQEQNQKMQARIDERESRERAHIADIKRLDDGALMRKARSSYLSDEDRAIVEQTLRERGYYKDSYGHYNR